MAKKYITFVAFTVLSVACLLVIAHPKQAHAEESNIDVYCTGATASLKVAKDDNGDATVTCSNPSTPFAVYPDSSVSGSPTENIDFICSGSDVNSTPNASSIELSCPTDQGANSISTVTILNYATKEATTWDVSGAQAVQNGTTQQPNATPPAGSTAKGCDLSASFFGLKAWYAYLPPGDFVPNASNNGCDINLSFVSSTGGPNQTNIDSVWLIGLAIFEDLLRLAGALAFGFIIYGGIRYITSQGEPDNTNAARTTILNALIGAAIAAIAAVAVSFIGTKLGAG
jgi:type IV secretion system pilin